MVTANKSASRSTLLKKPFQTHSYDVPAQPTQLSHRGQLPNAVIVAAWVSTDLQGPLRWGYTPERCGPKANPNWDI